MPATITHDSVSYCVLLTREIIAVLMVKVKWVITFLLVTNSSFAQQIKGFVVDGQAKPIPYVNIGIVNTVIGTLSMEDDKKTLAKLRDFENNPLPWLVGDISNNNMIIRNNQGKVVRKVRMTPSQLQDLEKRRLPRTYFRTRAASSTRYQCYSRETSFAPWQLSKEDVLVAGVEIEHEQKEGDVRNQEHIQELWKESASS